LNTGRVKVPVEFPALAVATVRRANQTRATQIKYELQHRLGRTARFMKMNFRVLTIKGAKSSNYDRVALESRIVLGLLTIFIVFAGIRGALNQALPHDAARFEAILICFVVAIACCLVTAVCGRLTYKCMRAASREQL
jgi:hypothetical protein